MTPSHNSVIFEGVQTPFFMLASQIAETMNALGWDQEDDIVVEIGGTVISGIHQGENYNKKWAIPYGVQKYNKDAFIVINNRSRTPFEPSQPNPDLVAHHARIQPTETTGTDTLIDQSDNNGTATE